MPLQCGLLNPCTLAICASIGWEQFMKFSDTLMSADVTFCVMSLADWNRIVWTVLETGKWVISNN